MFVPSTLFSKYKGQIWALDSLYQKQQVYAFQIYFFNSKTWITYLIVYIKYCICYYKPQGFSRGALIKWIAF